MKCCPAQGRSSATKPSAARSFPEIAGVPPIDTKRPITLLAALLALSGASALPETGPLPLPRPAKTQTAAGAEKPAEALPQESAEDSEACRAALTAIGARFEERPALREGKACGIGRTVELTALAGGVAVEPPVTLRCETALQLARWMEKTVKPALAIALPGETITGLRQASGYVCRNRNHAENGKVSEHAFGNAVDIAGFTLKSGKALDIRPADRDSTLEGAFQRAITEAACLHFTTVLDPGSDAAHADHLHLDVKARRGGYRYCW